VHAYQAAIAALPAVAVPIPPPVEEADRILDEARSRIAVSFPDLAVSVARHEGPAPRVLLRESEHAHVLTLSPPLSADPRWLAGHSAYTLSKMGMTMITLGVAADEAEAGIGANCLWPRTIIATAAVQNLLGGDEAMRRARTPEIVADAAHAILVRDPRSCTGNAFIDDEVLAEAGITDLDRYAAAEDTDLSLDIFVDGWPEGVPA
jgi:NAD(P)-dependent dehydrogenase (short-subunit alcohol dehydrogenase family)